MSINLHKEAEKAFNKTAFELIELIEEKDTEILTQLIKRREYFWT
jgi:phage gp29-like protein